jgi:hypothetical protein
MSYAAKLFSLTLLGWSDTIWTIIFAAIWIFTASLPTALKRQYISYSDDGELIVFRYFTAGIIGGRKNAVEIDKKTFAGYKTETRFFGLYSSITLYQNFTKGMAKYPPIYTSALNKKEKAKIFGSLDQYSPKH